MKQALVDRSSAIASAALVSALHMGGPRGQATGGLFTDFERVPGYENLGKSFSLHEEWYALKNINPDVHALQVIETKGMNGDMYDRPNYPTAWARMEGKGRVYYNAMGHREDVWDGDLFKNMIIGAVAWTTGAKDAAVPANLKETAPDFATNKNQ